MDESRFDLWTRRRFSHVASGSVAAGLLANLLGWSAEQVAGKKRRKKKKKPKPSSCTPSCFNKVCGQDNGCGSRCTVQAGCDADVACVDGECVANACNPACTGKNRICVGGACICRAGTKECPNGLGHCHECCQDFGGAKDDECVGHPDGEYCDDFDNDQVMECGCLPGQQNCGDGKCVACCTNQHCAQNDEDPRICVGGGCVCDEANGWRECVVGIWKDHCRHIDDDPQACGTNCVTCSTSPDLNQICQGGTCCLPSGRQCGNNPQNCCASLSCDLNDEGTAFVCR
ncbi:MAG: hypothetical protein ACRDJC_14555 [Thermomicrobiales bacterium]